MFSVFLRWMSRAVPGLDRDVRNHADDVVIVLPVYQGQDLLQQKSSGIGGNLAANRGQNGRFPAKIGESASEKGGEPR